MTVWYRDICTNTITSIEHPKAGNGDPNRPNIRRRNALTEFAIHRRSIVGNGGDDGNGGNDGDGQAEMRLYQGGSYLIRRVEAPYHFVLEVQTATNGANGSEKQPDLDKIPAIVALEKPAHTIYPMQTTVAPRESTRRDMVIGVRSSVGLDTDVG